MKNIQRRLESKMEKSIREILNKVEDEDMEKPEDMFPTCVGMNRRQNLQRRSTCNVPHMRGDEPPNR
jgi:hypothetical protein